MAATTRPPSARPVSAAQSAAVARPGTASRLAAQAAANSKTTTATARPGTGRGGASLVSNNVGGGGVVSERLRTGRSLLSGRGRNGIRSTRDRAYFIGALRSKLLEIINETNRLKGQSKDFAELRDLGAATNEEYEVLVKTVTDLRGTQHDYEAMLESVAKGVTNDDIQVEIEELRQQNGYLSTEVQELLNERESRENQLKKLQDRAKKYETAGEALLREMSEEDQTRYREMERELSQQTEVEERLLSNYEAIKNGERTKLEEELMFSPLKKEAAQVYARIRDLQSTLDDLKEQTGRSPEQEQMRLMEKIKSDNAEISALERQSHTLQNVLETMQQQMGGRRNSSNAASESDNEQQEFLANYGNHHAELRKNLNKSQEENLRLLEQFSRNVAALNDLPITTEADLMKSGQQLRSTVGQVKQEQRMREDLLQMNVEERSRELRKLETLLETLNVEKKQHQAEIMKWEGVNRPGVDLKAILAQQTKEMKQEVQNLEEKRKLLRETLDKNLGDLQRARSALDSNSFHKKIVAAEDHLQQVLGQTFDVEEAIAEASVGLAYEQKKEVVLRKAKEINEILQRLTQLEKNSLEE